MKDNQNNVNWNGLYTINFVRLIKEAKNLNCDSIVLEYGNKTVIFQLANNNVVNIFKYKRNSNTLSVDNYIKHVNNNNHFYKINRIKIDNYNEVSSNNYKIAVNLPCSSKQDYSNIKVYYTTTKKDLCLFMCDIPKYNKYIVDKHIEFTFKLKFNSLIELENEIEKLKENKKANKGLIYKYNKMKGSGYICF